MAFELKDGQGSLFKNDRKVKDSQPDYTGKILIAGVTYRLSAWITEGKRGKFMSLSAQEPDGGGYQGQSRVRNDEDIPF